MTSVKLTIKRGDTNSETIIVDETNLTQDIPITLTKTVDNVTVEWFNNTIKAGVQGPDGEIDVNGIKWLVARGQLHSGLEQTRDKPDDDRWSHNIHGLSLGYEQTMIAKSINVGSDGHFASKLFGGNHSGDGAEDNRWYDLGLRKDGTIQLQWEGPHPRNQTFEVPDNKQPIKRISKGLEGNWIGLKWCCEKVNKQTDGSPDKGGIRVRMWVDEDPLDGNGKPRNNWQLAVDFIDGEEGDVKVIQPQSYCPPDELDCEIRRSNTKTHEVFAGGLHVRAL